MLLLDNFFVLLSIVVLLTVIVFYVGEKLAIYADKLAVISGISGAFIGFILIAAITSIPEMVSTMVSVNNNLIDLAFGGVLGSTMVNVAILSVVSLLLNTKQLQIESASVFSFLSSLVLLAVLGIFITSNKLFALTINNYLIIALFTVIYVLIMRHSYKLTNNNDNQEQQKETGSLISIVSLFIMFSFLIVLCAWILVFICEKMTTVPIFGVLLGEHFVGTLLLAVATSIPELATTVQMMRKGMSNMAVGNIAGSNVFNLMVLVCASVFSTNNFWMAMSLSNFYTIFMIFIVSLLICIISFIKESKYTQNLIHITIILLWVYSLVLVF